MNKWRIRLAYIIIICCVIVLLWYQLSYKHSMWLSLENRGDGVVVVNRWNGSVVLFNVSDVDEGKPDWRKIYFSNYKNAKEITVFYRGGGYNDFIIPYSKFDDKMKEILGIRAFMGIFRGLADD